MEHLTAIIQAAKEQAENRITAHLEVRRLGKRDWAELMSTQHYLHKNLARLLFSTSAHADFFRRPMLREFLLQLAHSLEIDSRTATDALRTMRQSLRPISLEVELCLDHMAKVSADRPFAVIGALSVFISLSAECLLRGLLGEPIHGDKREAKRLDRLGPSAGRACTRLREQVGYSLPTYRHRIDLAEGASLARLFALRMLDQDLGWNYADLFPLPAKKPASLSRPAMNSRVLVS